VRGGNERRPGRARRLGTRSLGTASPGTASLGTASRTGAAIAAALAGLLLALVWGTAGDEKAPAPSALTGESRALAGVVAADQAGVDRARARVAQLRVAAAPAPGGTPRKPPAAACAGRAADGGAGAPGCADDGAARADADLTPVSGTAIVVALNDTPVARRAGPWPSGVRTPVADDLVVHQQDVQAVVNALWTGGARAMTLMGRRVTARTAVRCVGNTLLLEGKVYSPPFVVAAIGDPARLRAALDADPGVALYREYVDAYGLGYRVNAAPGTTFPAATQPPPARYATPLPG